VVDATVAPVVDSYEADDTALAAGAIANGETQNRSIHAVGNVDWATFTVGADGATDVRVETNGPSGDTEMWLYGPGDSTTLVEYDDDDGTGNFSLIARSSLAPGDYYIRIQDYGNNSLIAAYTLQVSWTVPLLPVAAPNFAPGPGTYPFASPPAVIITTATPLAAIYYTTDGSEPTSSSTLYTERSA